MKKPPIRILIISCLGAAIFTVLVLSVVSAYSKSIVNTRENTPDYVRYQAQGYDFDTVTNKRNLLFCIYDEALIRCHLICIDEDKNTLDILDMPPSTYVKCDGFTGVLSDAYALDIFPNIISRFLMLDVHSYAYISLEDFMAACRLLEVDAREETVINSEAYLQGDTKEIKVYYSLLSRMFVKLDRLGSVEATAKLIGILVNELETDMTVSDMIELASLASELSPKASRIHLLPGNRAGDKNKYLPDSEKLSKLLNESFRIKGSVVPPDKLGIAETVGAYIQFEKLPENILDF